MKHYGISPKYLLDLVASALGYKNAAAVSESAAANSASSASASATNAASSATQAAAQASVAANYAGGSLTIAHAHTTGPRIIEPEYSRASTAFDFALKRYEYNERRWGPNGTLVEESTTNLLPAGSENFVTGWTNGTGETCTVTDYPINIPGIGDVVAKRITGNGLGSGRSKYAIFISGRPNPHTDIASCQCMLLSGNAMITFAGATGSGQFASITNTMQRLSAKYVDFASTQSSLSFITNATTDILDIVVYAPQIENKSYATSYTPPGTTRAADSFALPVNAYQKNLLTPNQATGGDTLGDTTGFTASSSTLSYDTTVKKAGNGSIKCVTNTGNYAGMYWGVSGLVVGRIYTAHWYIRGTGTLTATKADAGATNAVPLSPIVLTDSFQLQTLTFTATATTCSLSVDHRTNGTIDTFYIDSLQLEEGTTASDWTLPSVDYTNALLNPTAGTVRISFMVPQLLGRFQYIIDFCATGSNNNRIVAFLHTNGTICLQVGTGSTYETLVGVTPTPGAICHLGITWGNKVSLWVDGVKKATSINSPVLLPTQYVYVAQSNSYTSQLNGYVSDIEFAKIARTDTEMAYIGTLTPDQYTTYCSECKESISSRPYIKDAQGVAQSIITASDPIRERGFINGGFELADRGTSFSNPATDSKILNGIKINYDGSGQTFIVSQQSTTPGQMDIPGAKNFLRYYQSVAPTEQTINRLTFSIDRLRELSGQKCMVDMYLRSPEAITLPMVYIVQTFGVGGSAENSVAQIANVKTKSNISRYVFPITIPSISGKTVNSGACIYTQFRLPLNSAFTLDIADFDIYPGTFPRPMPRPTLAALQRDSAQYLQKLPANLQLRAVNIQANYIDFESVVLPTEMRATPALSGTYAETTNWKVLVNNTQTTGFSLALLNASANQIAFRATKTAHGLTDATLQLVTNVLLSAEL